VLGRVEPRPGGPKYGCGGPEGSPYLAWA
jgi:hypothetical protein